MKVTSKEQFDAIQYTSIEVIRDFTDKRGIATTVFGDNMLIGTKETGCGMFPGEWLVVGYDCGDPVFRTMTDIKDRYQIPFTQEEKDFILKALTHVTSNSDDTHARVEDNVRIARIKQQILDKL